MEEPMVEKRLVDRYLSDQEKREIEQFYKALGFEGKMPHPTPEIEAGPLYDVYGQQTVVDCPISCKDLSVGGSKMADLKRK